MDVKQRKEKQLVLDYLMSECYIDTYSLFGGVSDPHLHFRKELKHLILSGEIEKAYAELEKRFSGFFKAFPEASSLLNSQIFIELVRKEEPEKALLFGRMCIQNGEDITQPNTLFLLLAYKNPEDTDILKNFLALERREKVFASIDSIIKEKLHMNRASQLEYLVRFLDLSEKMKKPE